MKSKALLRSCIPCLLSAVILAAFVAQGCQWDHSKYDRYVGERGSSEPCKGICVGDNLPTTQEECKAWEDSGAKIIWTEAKCLIDGKYLAVDKSACDDSEGTWLPGECKVLDETTCLTKDINENTNRKWLNFHLYDIGNGQYIRVEGDTFYCGTYDQITSNNPEKCTIDGDYLEDIKLGLCNTTTFCRSVKLNQSDVAACTACPTGSIQCGSECVDINNDANHCGNCGNSCEYETTGKLCINGVCDSSCKKSDGSSEEGDICPIGKSPVCVGDLKTNKEHCGSCGHACKPEQFCAHGTCVDQKPSIECDPAEKLLCMDGNNPVCVPKRSPESCGTKECTNKEVDKFCKCEDIVKGKVCEGSLICGSNSECVCPEGLFLSRTNPGQCNNPENPATCGANKDNPDGTQCNQEQKCNGKECVCNEGIECGGRCIDPLKDHEFCGLGESCDQFVQCKEDETCTQGVCRCTNPLQAKCGPGGSCIDVNTDTTHCGAKGECNAEDYRDDNFAGFACFGSGRIGCDNGSCVCADGHVFDKKTRNCVKKGTTVESCGTDTDNLMNCQLFFGDKADCIDGRCVCQLGWITVDKSLSWYNDLSDKRFRCIDPTTDNEFCGANSENRGVTCEKGMICVQGICQEPDACQEGVGQQFLFCKEENCLMKADFNLANCDKCKEKTCSYTNLAKDGCLGIVGTNCVCKDDQVIVDFNNNYGIYQACADWKDLNKQHIVVSTGTNTQLICEDGWFDSTGYHHKDGSLRFVSDDVCSIHIDNDVNNCGEVGNVCESANSQNMITPVCNAGVCQFGACAKNYGDCNEDMLSENSDGCETPLNTTRNCGACGKECGSNRDCVDGVCCIGDGIETNDVKSFDCCSGLKKYSKCTLDLGSLGCFERSYMCAATQPEDYEEWTN